jgi:hypothetical protein
MKKLLLVILVILTILITFVPTIEQFTISNGNTKNIVFSGSIDNFKKFYISFTHSVNRTPVNEYYRIENNKFYVYKTTFYSFGAGMPDGSDNPNAHIVFNDNGLVEIDNINRELSEFTYMVGTYADHTLHTENESFKLDKYVEPQEPAVFQIRRVSIFDILRRKINE